MRMLPTKSVYWTGKEVEEMRVKILSSTAAAFHTVHKEDPNFQNGVLLAEDDLEWEVRSAPSMKGSFNKCVWFQGISVTHRGPSGWSLQESHHLDTDQP